MQLSRKDLETALRAKHEYRLPIQQFVKLLNEMTTKRAYPRGFKPNCVSHKHAHLRMRLGNSKVWASPMTRLR